METKYQFTGFVRDMAYTANCSAFLQTYTDQFPGIDKLNLVVEETPYTMLGNPRPSTVEYSEDGTALTISTTTSKYYDRKGRVTSVPDAQSLFTGLKFLLDQAAKAHQDKIGEKSSED